ncbi:Type IV secretory pathway, VirD4 components [Comamonas aquatica]|jgi:conjugative coupling factor TraD (TOL family)|uniref:type IV conjugative transfer system coupling protein TraD n=1 Tax=Comamonas aquatica TaxID=225991 RepID=UPI001EF1EA98|nr:type IV conjugative transfer system coupling protein TraD [Comamonas aquatica]CAB5695319.1 Type IV secretory pathway, VirD4 components [Comamonas aquatica]CAC9218025.1 Type IV secretory pathway, VirD4 components [Comamonas aquatica]
MSDAVMEGLLRPPVEAYSAATAFGIAGVAAAAPWALMMPHSLGLVAAAISAGFGAKRCGQAFGVYRYQRGLKFTKMTRVPPHRLPVTKEHLYLGEGFEWTQVHTQRKLDTRDKRVQEYVRPSLRELRLARLGESLRNWTDERSDLTSRLVRTAIDAGGPANPFASGVDLGGSPILHGVGVLEEKPVKLRQSARSGHMLVMGTTRVGKTRLLELLCTQDIHAGHVTIVIDPKGDADLMLRMQAEARRAGRESSFYLFHLGYPEISARYNGIGSFARITEVAGRATNALPSSGNSAAFKEFSWRFTNIVAQAQVALGRIPTYETLLKDVTGIDPLFMDYANMVFRRHAAEGRFVDYEARIERIISQIAAKKAPVPRSLADRAPELVAMFLWIKESRLDDKVLLGLAAAFSYERSFYEKIVASLGPFLEKLTSGAVGKLISPDYFDPEDTRPIFDWMTVFRQGGIVYAGLDALSDAVVSSAVGNSMLADLVSVGGKLYKTGLDPHNQDGKLKLPNVCCHFDEVNEIAGPEFVPMVNKLGGSGFKITAYTQSMFDIEAKVGDKAKAGQIMDNFNHLVMLRVRSVATANLLAEQVPQVNVVQLTPMSGVTDTAAQGNGVDFVSRNDDIATQIKVPLIEASDILELPQGQAFALLEGNRRYKIRIPLADTTGDPFVPHSLKAVAEDMKRRYRTSERWAAETDWLGSQPLGRDLIDTTLAADEEDSASTLAGAGQTALGHGAVIGSVMGGRG